MVVRNQTGPSPQGSTSRPRRGYATLEKMAEPAGVITALVIGATVLAHMATSARAWILFSDGDSVLPLLVGASLRVGQPQDWILTSPLFLVEAPLYLPLVALNLPSRAAMVLFGVVTWVAFYLVIRAVASMLPLAKTARVAASVATVAVVGALALCESSADRNSLELASLLSTTTYYSGTVIATIAAVAIVARSLVHPERSRNWLTFTMLTVVTAVAVLSNPLFAAWAVAPLVVSLAISVFAGTSLRHLLVVSSALAGGIVVGMLARIPFGSILVQDSMSKVQPWRASESASYYFGLLRERLSATSGWVELALVSVMLVIAVITAFAAVRQRWAAGAVIATFAMSSPVIVIVGAVACGTFASRYLEPVALFPSLALIPATNLLAPYFRRFAADERVLLGRVAGVGTSIVVLIVACVAGVQLARVIPLEDQSLACVSRWIDLSGKTGAGQYWTVRAPKASLEDPRQLIQTDTYLNGYSWLTNDDDFSRTEVTFTIAEGASLPFVIPGDIEPTSTITCGRYTINDYSPTTLLIGTPHH